MKKVLIVLVLLATAYWSSGLLNLKSTKANPKATKVIEEKAKRIQEHVTKAKDFLNKNPNYNPDVVFLADMKIMSGKNRLFIYDLKKNEVIDQGLVAHGYGSETGVENELKFSNLNNSNATSLGNYSIGESYEGKFGKSYKLYGLDATNSNAFSRYIVLHKYSKMPYDEQLSPVCNSLGCPMVNEIYFKRIEKIVDASEKKILLDIYY